MSAWSSGSPPSLRPAQSATKNPSGSNHGSAIRVGQVGGGHPSLLGVVGERLGVHREPGPLVLAGLEGPDRDAVGAPGGSGSSSSSAPRHDQQGPDGHQPDPSGQGLGRGRVPGGPELQGVVGLVGQRLGQPYADAPPAMLGVDHQEAGAGVAARGPAGRSRRPGPTAPRRGAARPSRGWRSRRLAASFSASNPSYARAAVRSRSTWSRSGLGQLRRRRRSGWTR